MKETWIRMQKSLVLLSLGASTFLFSGTFGPTSLGCNYATYSDYQALFTEAGAAAIGIVASNFSQGADSQFDTVVLEPATGFAQSVWANWVDFRVPNDIEVQ